MKISKYFKDPRGVQKQAMVFSAFAKAFGKSLITGAPPQSAEPLPGCVRFWGKKSDLYLEPDICLQVENLFARIVVRDISQPLTLEEKCSYDLHVEGGKFILGAQSLANLLNRHVFPGTMIEKISIVFEGQLAKMEARINFRHINLPVSLESTVELSPEGRIDFRTKKVSSPNFILSGLLRFFPVEIERVLNLPDACPLSVEGDTLSADPEGIIPCPKVFGRLAKAEIEDERLVLTYAGKIPKPPLLEPAPHYLMCLGHELAIGKILLRDACLQVISSGETLPERLGFSLEGYLKQLSEGSVRIRPDGAILASIPNLTEN